VQFGFFQQAMLFELFLDDGQRELRAVHRHVQLRQNVGNRADVIFVRVGQHDGADFIFVLLQVGDVRDDDVHAEQFLLREHQTGVDHDDVFAAAKRHHVHAKFAQSAQRNGPQRLLVQFSLPALRPSAPNGIAHGKGNHSSAQN
jgi:hypothetical protein